MKNIFLGLGVALLAAFAGFVVLEIFEISDDILDIVRLLLIAFLVIRFAQWVFKDTGFISYVRTRLIIRDKPAVTRAIKAFESKKYEQAVKELMPQAEEGDAFAQYILGVIFSERKDCFQNSQTAVAWFKKAARQGLAEAQYAMGECYYHGKGVVQNYEKSRLILFHAAEQDYQDAHYLLGVIYVKGAGVPVDHKKAVEHFLISAKAGDRQAQRALADIYYHGLGVPVDKRKAIYWTKRAAKQGEAVSEHNLGLAYQQGDTVWKNPLLSKYWFKRSHGNVWLEMGNIIRGGRGAAPKRISHFDKTPIDNFEDLKNMAQEGKAEAQFELGQMYFKGRGVRKNMTMAHRWWFVAAEQGHMEAQIKLEDLNRVYPMQDASASQVEGKP